MTAYDQNNIFAKIIRGTVRLRSTSEYTNARSRREEVRDAN